MRTEWKLALLLMGISAVCMPSLAADGPSAIRQVAGQAERTAETNRQLSGYYRYSRYRDLRPSENPVSVSEGEKEKPLGEISFMVKEVRVSSSKFLTEEEVRAAVRFPCSCPSRPPMLLLPCSGRAGAPSRSRPTRPAPCSC